VSPKSTPAYAKQQPQQQQSGQAHEQGQQSSSTEEQRVRMSRTLLLELTREDDVSGYMRMWL
jgi:hypothetical protein